MNVFDYSLRQIKFQIPPELLNITFTEYYDATDSPLSIDERIMSKVLRPRVYQDCNMISGIHTKIDLSNIKAERIYTGEWILRVPKSKTQGKSILSPLELICNVMYPGIYTGFNTTSTLDIATKMYNNLASHNIIQSSKLELIGENTILVHDNTTYMYASVLRCVLEYDENLSTLPPRSFRHIAHLCVLAVKAYIYTHLYVKLDQGYIYGGHELGTIKELADSYSDANEQYDEYLKTVVMKVLFMSDGQRYERYINTMFGNVI